MSLYISESDEITSFFYLLPVAAAQNVGVRIPGTKFVLDLISLNSESCLERADLSGVCDGYVRSDKLGFLGFGEMLERAGITRIWVEILPETCADINKFVAAIQSLPETIECIPVTGDYDFAQAWFATENPHSLALKGVESAGLVSADSIHVLYSAVEKIAQGNQIYVWGGVGTPEAAAAFLGSGASGIVFESVHWLTDLMGLSDDSKERVRRLRYDNTALVGRATGMPWRFFDKGNSKAVRQLTEVADCLGETELKVAGIQLAKESVERMVEASVSVFSADELIPLGPESSFASLFESLYGSSNSAFTQFSSAVWGLINRASQILQRFDTSSAAKELGVDYPIIQGGMTWITDNFAFAREVEEAGALPTLTLGLRNTQYLEQDFGSIIDEMGDRPYSVNALLLDENPFRDEQLVWIEKVRPPFVTIAAGDPAFVKRFAELGIRVIYLAATVGLLKLAVKAGADFVVLEGNEAGGHVGENTTLTLCQAALVLRQEAPEIFTRTQIVIAGGIYDRKTAFRAAMLGADAVQMGTAYLATKEIHETGALRQQYQNLIVDSKPGATVLSGESIGLRVRSLKTPKLNDICALERTFAANNVEESERRMELEKVSVGTLFVAARGLDRSDGSILDDDFCFREGQYMSGSVAGNVSNIKSLSELHASVAAEPIDFVEVPENTIRKSTNTGEGGHERVAITGMAAINSLGHSYDEIIEASINLQSGVRRVPADRWDHSRHYALDARVPDVYTDIGAFMNVDITRKDINVSPQDFRTMADSTRLTLLLARQALEESGILDSDISKQRIAVITSQNSAESASTFKAQLLSVHAEDIVDQVAAIIPMTAEQREKAVKEMRQSGLAPDDTTLVGRLNCTAAGHVCNQYGFNGPSYSVGAACASSLIALHCAMMLMRQGLIDAAVVGGGEETLTPGHYYEFSALGSLAGMSGKKRNPSAYSRPFDMNRDGFVLGEGGAVLVIERESVARARGAQSHAYIAGIGASTNHLGIVESVSSTQQIALRASFDDIPYGPDEIDLIECHGTSTNQGDREEVRALSSVYPAKSGVVLSSFKSQIGHTLGASGLTSLIRGVMAMKNGVLPPTLNYETRDPEIRLEEAGFRVLTKPEPWPCAENRPRRMQINAFGFGGASYVVHVEGTEEDRSRVWNPEGWTPALSQDECNGNVATYKIVGQFGTALAATASLSPFEVNSMVSGLAGKEQLSAGIIAKFAGKGLFVALEQTFPIPLAWIFAGQGGWYTGMGRELYQSLPGVRATLDMFNDVAEFDLLDLMFNASAEKLQNTKWQQPALFALEYAIAKHLLDAVGSPDAVAGHSLGEFTALCVAGVLSPEDAFRIVCSRGQLMDEAADKVGDPGGMIATDTPVDILTRKLKRYPSIFITNYNSPSQTVLGGPVDTLDEMVVELKEQGFRAVRLKVSMAFHSSVMADFRDEFRAVLESARFNAPRIPVVSNVSGELHLDNPEVILDTLVEHLESPVLWTQNVYTLWEEMQIRSFLEVGPADTLCSFVEDIFSKAECRSTCREGMEYQRVQESLAWLYARGLGECEPLELIDISGEAKVSPPPSRRKLAQPDSDSVLERVIQIIMDSTGYERDEIEPSMDIRQDLNIRSSRLPLIMDEAEQAFDLEFRIEDFIGVETINDLAGRIAELKGVDLNAVEPSQANDGQAVLERVIQIIMDSTGYERDEIEPSMDIRQDLNIRSSRLPLIMDEAEQAFDLEFRIEDFIGVETINDLAGRIAELKGVDLNAVEPSQASDGQVVLERVIQIIMDSTGYERDEIEPSMDIRQDLNIRSSRLPLIMDEAEQAFGLEFRIEDFIGVETVQDLSDRILDLKAGKSVSSVPSVTTPKTVVEPSKSDQGDMPVLRYEFMEVPARKGVGLPAYESSAGPIAIVSFGHSSQFPMVEEWVRSTVKAESVFVDLNADSSVDAIESCQGMLLLLDGAEFSGETDTTVLLAQVFNVMKGWSQNRNKKFCVAVGRAPSGSSSLNELSEGVLGILLAAAMEYASTVFRFVAIESDKVISQVLDRALMRDEKTVELIFRADGVKTREAMPVSFDTGKVRLAIKSEDVIVITGGARGVTASIAFSLATLGARLVLLGRSSEDSSDVVQTMQKLSEFGCEAMYFSCDVADAVAVQEAIDEAATLYGRVDAILHGAGVLKDNFLQLMPIEDFNLVMRVKLQGVKNVVNASSQYGLRAVSAFSSVAAWHGNIGQASYCAANRAMAAYLDRLSLRGIDGKTIWLPPVDGVGMANDPEVKKLLDHKGMGGAYVPIVSLAEFVRLEIAKGGSGWTMFSRPVVDPGSGKHFPLATDTGKTGRTPVSLPMIDDIYDLNLEMPKVGVEKIVSHSRDLWLADHKPYPMLKYPLFSAVMAVETFMASAKVLYPDFTPISVKNVRFLDMIPCAEGAERHIRTVARGMGSKVGAQRVETVLSCRDMSPKGRQLDTWSECYTAQVLMSTEADSHKLAAPAFTELESLSKVNMSNSKVLEVYAKYTAQLNRYQVIQEITKVSGRGVVGTMIYGEENDFSSERAVYQYSPYLLEALMQLVLFQPLAAGGELSAYLPVGIGEMSFARLCIPGEVVTLKACLRTETNGGMVWDCAGYDQQGTVLMVVDGLTMKRLPN